MTCSLHVTKDEKTVSTISLADFSKQIGLSLPTSDPHIAGQFWLNNGVLNISQPVVDLNWADGTYLINDVSHTFDDVVFRWFANNSGRSLTLVPDVGMQLSGTVSCSSSVFSQEILWDAVGPVHTGVLDITAQYTSGGTVDIDLGLQIWNDWSGPLIGLGNWGSIDGLYWTQRFDAPAWTVTRETLQGPLTSGLHRISYSISPTEFLMSMDGGPVFKRTPISYIKTDLATVNVLLFYMGINGPDAKSIHKRSRFYTFVDDPMLLQQMSTLERT